MPYLFAILSAAGFGVNDLFIHLGMRSGKITSDQALIINLIAGNLLLLIVGSVVFITIGLPPLNWTGVMYFIASGLSAPFLGRIFSFSAIKHIGATRTTTLRVNDVFFTMLIAYFFLKDMINLSSVVGAVVLVAGVIILVNETNKAYSTGNEDEEVRGFKIPAKEEIINKITEAVRNINIGAFFALLSAFLFALGGVFREVGLEYVPSAILGAMVGTFTAFVTNGSFIYFSGRAKGEWNISRREATFFALGGVGNTIGMLMFFLALGWGGSVSMTAALKNTSPLITLLLSWIFLRNIEKFTPALILSIFLVILGAFLIVI